MARAKVPKVKERYGTLYPGSFGIARLSPFRHVCDASSTPSTRRICRALNLLAAIERGELIVKEAE